VGKEEKSRTMMSLWRAGKSRPLGHLHSKGMQKKGDPTFPERGRKSGEEEGKPEPSSRPWPVPSRKRKSSGERDGGGSEVRGGEKKEDGEFSFFRMIAGGGKKDVVFPVRSPERGKKKKGGDLSHVETGEREPSWPYSPSTICLPRRAASWKGRRKTSSGGQGGGERKEGKGLVCASRKAQEGSHKKTGHTASYQKKRGGGKREFEIKTANKNQRQCRA